MRRRAIWVLAAVLAAAITGGTYAYTHGLGRPAGYRTEAITRGPLVAAISATGTLNAVISVQVGSQVSGLVKELYADFNSRVTKNQIIAQIDPEPFEAKVSQAQAQVEAARALVVNQGAAVHKDRADLENARAALASSHAQTAKALVSVVDGRRNLGRQQDLRRQELIAQADLDAAQVALDSAVAQHEASEAQERAQAAAVTSAEAQLE